MIIIITSKPFSARASVTYAECRLQGLQPHRHFLKHGLIHGLSLAPTGFVDLLHTIHCLIGLLQELAKRLLQLLESLLHLLLLPIQCGLERLLVLFQLLHFTGQRI